MDTERIIGAVSRVTGVSREELMAGSRCRKPIADARMLAMWAAYQYGPDDATFTTVGEAFGRDRTTVRHAVEVYEADPSRGHRPALELELEHGQAGSGRGVR